MNFHLKHATKHGTNVRTSQKKSMHEKKPLLPLISKEIAARTVRSVPHAILPGWRKQCGSGSLNLLLGFYPDWSDEIGNVVDNSASWPAS